MFLFGNKAAWLLRTHVLHGDTAPVVAECACRAQNDIPEKGDGRHLSCLSPCGHKTTREGHHCTSTSGTVVCSRYSTVYYQTSPTKTDGVSESVRCVHEHALSYTQSQTCPPVLARRCAPCDLASDLERRTGVRHQRYPEAPRQPEKAVTCGENQAARKQTVDAPSVHQQNARWKTPAHAHGASNHTMDTTGTCHPQKLRWRALTWKPIANGERPTPMKQAMCHSSSDAA